MALTVLYFAWVREAIGTDAETVAPADGIDTVAALVDWLALRSPGHAAAFADRARLRYAVDQQVAGADAAIGGAREIAIFPPVTGG